MTLLPAIEHETSSVIDSAIIWLHGLGADGNDFAPIVPQLKLPQDIGIRFIFPHAPSISVTINGGFVMPAWYDILEMDIERKVDTKQLIASATAVSQLIKNEMERGVESSRIILAGFSQGGAVAYQTALSSSTPLGGLLAMSTYFATSDSVNFTEENKNIPIEIHHGTFDPVVPEHLGRKSFAFLSNKGYRTNYQTYPMEHNVCPQQIDDIAIWISNILG